MQLADRTPHTNHILAALPLPELMLIRPHLIRTRGVNGQTLHEPGERMDQVFFFETGFASMVAIAGNSGGGSAGGSGGVVEIALIGPESMVGLGIATNPAGVAFNRTMVQMPGLMHRMPAAALTGCLDQAPVLRALMLQRQEVLFAQVSQTAACNSRHTLAQRCARWLLLAHDRVEDDELLLTQEFLSMMLAVRRAGVTVAMQALQAAGLIQSKRGRVLVLDRPGLEAAACGCYARVRGFTAGVQSGTPKPRFEIVHERVLDRA